MTCRSGVIARRFRLARLIIAVIIFVHVPNCFGYVMVIIADGELWDMALPCSEARSRLSRPSRGLRSKRDVSTGGPRTERKRQMLEGTWLEHKRLIHSNSVGTFKAHSANWSGRGRTHVQRGSDDSTEDDVPASRNLRRTRPVKPPPCVFPLDVSFSD